jgi:hypothetical protein
LNHLHSAIDLLDQADAPEQIAAHADLAMHQLREWLGNFEESAGRTGAP